MSTKPRIHYVCQRCTACCKWPGDVNVTDAEVSQIAEFLEMPEHEFVQDFTRINHKRTGLSLVDKEGSDECIMLDGVDCRLQEVKPAQCRGFPNTWNFPGWREVCEAKEVILKSGEAQP